MLKVLKWTGIVILSLIVIAALFVFQPWVFLPHKPIEIGLPILPQDDKDTFLIPLGEKIYHNEANGNPNGHGGMDLGGWERKVAIIAVADGWVFRSQKIDVGTTTVEVYSGLFYKNIYQELNEADPKLKTFSRVKKGQVLGYTGTKRNPNNDPNIAFPSPQLHWDFASSSQSINRLCPVGYLDADSRRRLETIWARMPLEQFKGKYPDICSGYYKDRED